MKNNNNHPPVNNILLSFTTIINAVVISRAFTHNSSWYWLLWCTVPLWCLALYQKVRQKKKGTKEHPAASSQRWRLQQSRRITSTASLPHYEND